MDWSKSIPADPAFTPIKHTLLGRFRHENVAIRTAANQRVIAYMGNDLTDGHVYKFVSDRTYTPGSAANRGPAPVKRAALCRGSSMPMAPASGESLSDHAAAAESRLVDTDHSGWRHDPWSRCTRLGRIVTDAFRAANLIGATPTGRPEDVEVHPLDNSVFIAFTAAATLGANLFSNIYGEIWRIVEVGDGTGTTFTWGRWKAGGPNDPAQAGRAFAAPDNLSFDSAGNMWLVTDMSSAVLNSDTRYTSFANNGMFFIPTSGPDAGIAFQFCSGPCEAELTGPAWTPNQHTLFLAIQHPGEQSGARTGASLALRGSNWPSGRLNAPPRPGVVAIRRA